MPNYWLTRLIEKKRNGEELCAKEIESFVNAVVKLARVENETVEVIDRSQIGAMLMAIYIKGLNNFETLHLTQKMKESGYIFSWPEKWKHLVVDKHSTGGVGDKISLILAPALAALGLKVPMVSGRSLGHTGGTLDKLESIPGFRTNLTKEEIYDAVDSVGCCVVGQTEDCVPADKVLYHCRDITATINCPSLIISSIVSKKLSEGTSILVYDVKFGKGSIFKSKEEAIETAHNLIEASVGVKASALLTSMDNPLGKSIGNSLEVLEAIECLKGRGPPDVLEITYALGSEILRQVQNTSDLEGQNIISSVLKNGCALEKFYAMMIQQGVAKDLAKEICYGNTTSILPEACYKTDIYYRGNDGYIQNIDPLVLAKWWKEEYSHSSHHRGVGITLLKTVKDEIQSGDVWAVIHHHSNKIKPETVDQLENAIYVSSEKCERIVVWKKLP